MRQSTNTRMSQLLASLPKRATTDLDSGLATYLEDGLVFGPRESLLSAAAYKSAHADVSRFEDRVAFECFVNKIHLDDWLSDTVVESTLVEKLAHAVVLADSIGDLAKSRGVSVAVIISADEESGDVVLRFHKKTPGDEPWAGDLESIHEPIAVREYPEDS